MRTLKRTLFNLLLSALFAAGCTSPTDYYAKSLASASYTPVSNQNGNLGDRYLFTTAQFTAQGVSASVQTEFSNWCKTLWPLGAWP